MTISFVIEYTLIHTGRRFYSIGFVDGLEHGKIHGRVEGRQLGREKGFEMWEELGFYEGFAKLWKSLPSTRPRIGGYLPLFTL